jgi:hypothetical protein
MMSIFRVMLLSVLHLSLALTRPVIAATIDVFDPTITYPTAGVVWIVGSNQTVSWRTSNIPRRILDSPGMILLGHMTNNSENLNIGIVVMPLFAICIRG